MKKLILLTLAIAAAGSLIYFIEVRNNQKPLKDLPVLGNPGHVIGEFSFTDQNGKQLTLAHVKGKVLVVDYFFTTCQSICPIMNRQMMRVDSATKTLPGVRLLSHTVDPETDTIAAMKACAQRHNASSNWYFLTGTKTELYRVARQSYLLDATDEVPPDISEDFIHTPDFALVDKQGRLRGAYNGAKPEEVDKLIADILILTQE